MLLLGGCRGDGGCSRGGGSFGELNPSHRPPVGRVPLDLAQAYTSLEVSRVGAATEAGLAALSPVSVAAVWSACVRLRGAAGEGVRWERECGRLDVVRRIDGQVHPEAALQRLARVARPGVKE